MGTTRAGTTEGRRGTTGTTRNTTNPRTRDGFVEHDRDAIGFAPKRHA
jgi:hypothetical protein